MSRFSSQILMTASVGLIACQVAETPPPMVKGIAPARIPNHVATPILIRGENFNLDVKLSLTKNQVQVSQVFVLTLETTGGPVVLEGVRWLSAEELSATVPAGAPEGQHGFKLIDPNFAEAKLKNALEIFTPQCVEHLTCEDANPCTRDERCEGFICVHDWVEVDEDGDGHVAAACGADDCDDRPGDGVTVYPGAPETIADGVDQNCDGVDSCYQDTDGDNHGGDLVIPDDDLDCTNDSSPTAALAGDCDDDAPGIHPGAVEGPFGAPSCSDGEDNDCDGLTDDEEVTCRDCVVDSDCADQNACNGVETCLAGNCQVGTALDCNDSNDCTADDCVAATDCVNPPVTDGDECGTASCAGLEHRQPVCQGGACVGLETTNCADDNPCSGDHCEPANGCAPTVIGDGEPCGAKYCDLLNHREPTCLAGACSDSVLLAACDDHNVCTTDSCDPTNGCGASPNSEPCSDSDPCTVGDTCSGGDCLPGTTEKDSDSDGYVDDACSGGTDCRDDLEAINPSQSEQPSWSPECHDGQDNDCDGALDLADTSCAPYCRGNWCWENMVPQGNGLQSIAGSGSDDIWAVGDHGTIMHWNGAGWDGFDSGTAADLQDVWVVAPDLAWAVGNSGTILRWDGSAWAAQLSISGGNLYGVTAIDQNTAWAVGQSGVVLFWNGTNWSNDGGPLATARLQEVFALTASEVWTVGLSGFTARRTPSGWNAVTNSDTNNLDGVWAFASNDVWAVGANGTVLHRTTGDWVKLASATNRNLHDIWGVSPNDVRAAGSFSTLIAYDGTAWSAQDSPVPNLLSGGYGAGASDHWVVGSSGVLLRMDGPPWYNTTIGRWFEATGVWAASPDFVLVVGNNTPAIMTWNGDAWTLVASGTDQRLLAVWGTSSDEAWAVGEGGKIVVWNGSQWQEESSGTTEILSGVSGTSADDVWAVGNNGVILHRNAGLWSPATSHTSNPLNAVFALSPTAAVAAGDAGTFVFWNGSDWAVQTPPTTENLRGVWAASETVWWAVGNAGTLKGWNGTTFSTPTSGMTTPLTAVWGSGPDDVWAVGASPGVVLHKNATGWAVVEPGLADYLYGITGANGHLWVVGLGAVIHRQP